MKCARSDAKTRDHPCNFEQRAQLAFCQVREINEENEVSMECKFSALFHCGKILATTRWQINADHKLLWTEKFLFKIVTVLSKTDNNVTMTTSTYMELMT